MAEVLTSVQIVIYPKGMSIEIFSRSSILELRLKRTRKLIDLCIVGHNAMTSHGALWEPRDSKTSVFLDYFTTELTILQSLDTLGSGL